MPKVSETSPTLVILEKINRMKGFSFVLDPSENPPRLFLSVPHEMRKEVFLCAGYDGATIRKFEDKMYFDADWFAREFQRFAPSIEWARAKAMTGITN